MASSWCSYHPGVSPNASGKREKKLLLIIIIITVIGSVLKAEWGNDLFIPPWLTVTSPPCVKLLRKWKGTAPRESDDAGHLLPVTVDLLYQTMGRHCLESGYIKILKTAWEGRKKNNNIKWCLQKIPQLYNAKNIFLYTHTYIYIYSIHNCSNL